MHRQLSISTSFDYDLSIDEQLPLVAAAGFTHVSLGGNAAHAGYETKELREHLRGLLNRHGLKIDTIHGPDAGRSESVDRLKDVIEAAAELGAPVIVAHGGPFDFPESELTTRLDTLLRTCTALQPLLARTNAVLALENVLPGPATDLVRFALPRLDRQHFGFCYDSAHDQIGGPRPFDLLSELNDRVRAVHLSDRIRDFVDHVPPGEGFIDWDTLCLKLRTSSFAGPLLFEVITTYASTQDPERLLAITYERGCELHDRIFG